MKIITSIASVLLGMLVLATSIPYFLHMMRLLPPMPEKMMTIMLSFMTTCYMDVVKTFELIGGILVLNPITRNLGLLVLGPIIVNILFVNFCVMKGVGVMYPMLAPVVILPLYLLWAERRA